MQAILKLSPDLVFLDARMPGMTGFDVIHAIGVDQMPAVIFLTAYEQHAVDAFRVNAVDYLLKPLDRAKLAEALGRARRDLAQQELLRRTGELASLLGQLGTRQRHTTQWARARAHGWQRPCHRARRHRVGRR